MPASESVYTIDGSLLTDIASAIRSKTGSSSAFTPAQMVSEIMNIPTGGGGDGNYWYDWTNLNPVIFGSQGLPNASLLSSISTNAEAIEAYQLCGTAGSSSPLKTLYASKCKYIGSWAFNNCKNLSSIYIPNCEYVGSRAFGECSNFSSIYLSKCKQIGDYAFYRCKKLSSIYLPVCEYIGSGAFAECSSSFKRINLPLCKVIPQGAFSDTSLEIADFPECESVDWLAFYRCYQLKSISLPKCKIVGYEAFELNRFSSINLPECLYISSAAFFNCSVMSLISIPKCKVIGIEAFVGCFSLSTISLPGVTQIQAWAFRSCSSLSGIYLLGSNFCALTWSAGLLTGTKIASGSGHIYVPSSLYSQYYNDSIWSWYRSVLTSY